MISTISLYMTTYYDNINGDYHHIIILNKKPEGPLKKFVKQIHINNGSSKIKKANESYCGYAISRDILSNNSNNSNNIRLNICVMEDITEIYDYLINNEYILNSDLTKLLTENTYMVSNNSKRLLFSFTYIIS